MSTLLNSSATSNTDARRALLAERLRRAAAAPRELPLSFAQQRLWFFDQLEPNSALYNVPTVARMTGELNVDALQRAMDAVLERHEVLRTRFVSVEGAPKQIVGACSRAKIGQHDLRHFPAADREREANTLVRAEVNRPFDLAAGPVIRGTLLRLADREHWFVLNMHHIVSDEWSLKICFRELTEFYTAFCEGRAPEVPELPIQYGDYTLWQRDWLRPELVEKQLAFWRKQLEGNPPVLELPADHPRPATQTFRGGTEPLVLPRELSAALKKIAEKHNATVFMVLLAAFEVLLHRYTQQDDIVIGSPVAGRNQLETERLIGFFVNTLLLRVDVSGDPKFCELLRRVREVTLNAWAHQDLPFEKLVERLHPERVPTHMPFTRVMFTVQNGVFEELRWPKLALRFIEPESETAKFDLTFVVQVGEAGLVLQAEYNRDLFETETITRMLSHFETLLRGVVANPDERLSRLPLLTQAELDQLLVRWNDTKSSYPRNQCIHQLFEAQMERNPGAVAVAFDESSVSYRELNERANRLARHLKRFGVGPDVLVGVCIERSVEMVVAILAVLKAGGAYVPIEATYPKERLAFMLQDTKAAVLLAEQKVLPNLPKNANVLYVDADWELIARESKDNLPSITTAEDLAYVVYTSGSTGQPKGVAVPHRAVNRLVLNTNYVRFTPSDCVAQVSNASFDAATFEIWGALLNGARLVGISYDVALSPKDFARELREKRISVMFLTAALFNQISAEVPDAFAEVGTMMFGGEAGDPKSVARVLQHGAPKHLLNGYGPTENTTFSACYEVREISAGSQTVPIGRPIANSLCYVLDAHMNPMPIGVPGELHVGGDGLARGYWNRPERTAAKFIANPFRPGEMLYKTGDLVRWRGDGTLEFLGRLDHQVKIRGFRVEPGEIETIVTRHPGISECVVIARTGEEGQKRLVAYFVPNGRRIPTALELQRFLKETLPDYMVPSVFVRLDALPLTPNGKVDRNALPEPGRGRPLQQKRLATPQDAVELKLTEIWENVLGVHPIGIEDKFFDLGGHSLLAVRLIAQIEKTFGKRLRLATVFQAPTIEQLAAILREEIQEGSAIAGTSLVEIHSQGARPPLFLVHGAGGGMFWGYVNLSRHLGEDQPVYGLKSRGLDGSDEFQSIEEMAAQYVADIRTLQPKGPYHLGGYCFGGNVAYEMARQLSAQGEEVALLVLLNCAPPNSSYDRIHWTPAWATRFVRNLFYWARDVRRWNPTHRREFFRWKKEQLRRRLELPLWQSNKMDAGNFVDLSSYSESQRKLWQAHIRGLANYHPQPWSGRVHLFRSPGHPLLCSFEANYGWRGLAKGGVSISIVPGVHEKILEEPCVASLAKELNKVLTETSASGNRNHPRFTRAVGLETAAPDKTEFWKQHLAGAPALLDLPSDRPRPAQLSGVTVRHALALPTATTDAVERFCRNEQCDPAVVLLAVFHMMLCRYTRMQDIVTGFRMPEGSDGALPLRTSFLESMAFRSLIAQMRKRVADVKANALPIQTIAQTLKIEENASYAGIYQVALEFGGSASQNGASPKLDLVLRLEKSAGEFKGWIEYSSDLFDARRIARMAGHFTTLLTNAVAEPEQNVSTVPMLAESEAQQLLVEWNATDKAFPKDTTLVSLFEAQAGRTPDATALVAGTERFTYRDLNEKAEEIAALLRSYGVGAGTLVAICLERSWRMIAGILGILKAGGAYVPLDPVYPKDRLAFILEDTQAPVLLTQASLKDRFQSTSCRMLFLDEPLQSRSAERSMRKPQPHDLAYIIYTSGSTGKPKGVMLEHRHAAALVYWARDVFTDEEIAGVLASTSICFDLSVFEMFVPLSWGGTVVLAENALALPQLPAAQEVTMINTVPSAIRELLRAKSIPPSVRVVNLAGEPLATTVVDRIYGETRAQKVYDLYGPSETTTYSTFTLRKAGEPATIGRPLANEQVYLLDRNLQPVPIGVPGEIFIGGDKVARGYLNRPELTAEKFIPNPFRSGTRVYRTGDLARWREDGNLEFLGRIDHQVKLRGFRIELGEIEAVLRSHAALRDVVVIVREDQPGDKRLIAYIVTKPGQQIVAEELRRVTKEQLPEYMAPSAFVFLDALPLTPNGKVDRKALPAPEPDRQSSSVEFIAPATPTEQKLASIWCEVLRIKQVGIHDNFFDLGGHSLLAMRAISQMRTTFNVEPPLSAMFDKPTIAALATGVDSGEWQRKDEPVELKPIPRDGDLPVSFMQEQLWFFNEMDPASYAYNMPIAFRLRGKLDLSALQKAADALASRHESLRTTFAYADGDLRQVIAAPTSLPVRAVRLAPGADQERELQTLANVEAQQAFDLQAGPLIRMTLFELSKTDHALVVVMHHAVSDGWSWAILFEELAALYDAFAFGKPVPVLPELPIQYADFAHWRRQKMRGAVLERELEYWKEKLKGAPPSIDLPTDRQEPEKLSDRADRRMVEFSKETSDTIAALGRREGCSQFMILMAALGAALQQWTRQQDMVIGTVVAGRSRRETENVIGCFMNFLPIRMQIIGDETGRTLLGKVRASVLDAQAHQECPFEKIVEAVNPERRLNQNPLYNVALLLQNFPEEVFPSRQLQVQPMHVEAHAPLVDLRFEALEQGGHLRLMCEFNADIFEALTIEQLLESYRGILEALVRTPDSRIADLSITGPLKDQARRSRARTHSHNIVVASTFTVEPIEESLSHWMRQLEIPAKVSFAPFNQVFQQLLDPTSLMGSNPGGLNVALLRVEDWINQDGDNHDGVKGRSPNVGEKKVQQIAEEFIRAAKVAASRVTVPLLVVLCPPPPQRAGAFDKIEARIVAELEKLSGVYAVHSRELTDCYPVAEFYDASGDELGRVPYTPVFFAALGTIIARKFHALLRPPRKVIVLDCDHTLWSGVCGEDGARGICLDAPYRTLQEFMRAQNEAGRLLAVCSKNNEEDVHEVFARRLEMPLRREHIIAWRLNWQPKSENIKSLAKELNLGLDSFIFVDDNPVECAEVEANCPEVLTLQLPEDPAQIPAFLKHCWPFDVLKVTKEDRRRGEMYHQNLGREHLRAESGSLADFIAGLDLKIQVAVLTPENIGRISQLTQRTNQFNATTIRRSEAEIRQLANTSDVLTVSVKDRFGDYGLTGVMICETRGDALDVDSFLLSCRVLGRGVEHEMLSKLGAIALERKLRWVNVHFHPSPKNKPALDFLQSIGAEFKQALNGGFVYRFPAEFAAEVTFTPADETPAPTGEKAEGQMAKPETDRATAAPGAAKLFRTIALEFNTPEKIHAAIEANASSRTARHSSHPEDTPRTDLERQLCELWQKLLRVERVGINDNFFDLGGHSLLAVRLFTEMEKITGCKLPLVTIFQATTIADLAKAIEENQTSGSRSVLVPIQPKGSRPPLFLVHGAGGDIVWGYANLAKHTHPDQPIYGIKSRGQIGLEEFDRIEDMARFYIEEIRAFQPNGPYYLGGYCFGGNVAYEMARQLYAQGERVAFLALIDASPSNAGYEKVTWWRPDYPFRFAKNLSLWIADFEQLPGAERRRYVSRKARVLARKWQRKFRRKPGGGGVDIEEVIDPIHFPERELKFWQIHLNAAVKHVEQPYAGTVTLIRTRGQPLFCSLAKDFCWGKLAHGGVEIRYIPGSHENIFMEPHVKVLAERLEQCLAEAQEPRIKQETLSHGLA